MTGQEKVLDALAKLLKAALVHDESATTYAEIVATRLGFDEDDSTEAVASVLAKALETAAEPAGPTLGDQIRASLIGAGFIDAENALGRAAFRVTEGVGVALGPFWANAPEAARSEQLATMAYLLETEANIDVPKRGQFLYVPDPKRVGQDTATAEGPCDICGSPRPAGKLKRICVGGEWVWSCVDRPDHYLSAAGQRDAATAAGEGNR